MSPTLHVLPFAQSRIDGSSALTRLLVSTESVLVVPAATSFGDLLLLSLLVAFPHHSPMSTAVFPLKRPADVDAVRNCFAVAEVDF